MAETDGSATWGALRSPPGQEEGDGDGNDEALRIRDAFLTNLEHSVLTPVAPVYLQLRRLVRNATETPDVVRDPAWLLPRLADLSDRFETCLRRLDHLCDLAVAISGGRPPEAEWVDLSEIVRGAAGNLERELAAAAIELTVDVSGGPVVGWWERARLEGLCSHLLSSSIRFGSGQPLVVTVESDERNAHLVMTAPRNNFDELGDREAAAGSLSVGLWAVRHLARAMGGTVGARCESDRGSTLTVTLPLRDTKPTWTTIPG